MRMTRRDSFNVMFYGPIESTMEKLTVAITLLFTNRGMKMMRRDSFDVMLQVLFALSFSIQVYIKAQQTFIKL